MSQTISMDTERTQTAARLLLQQSERMDAIIDNFAREVRRLNGGWDGGYSDAFCSEMDSLKRQLEKKAWELTNIAQRLQHEIDEWQSVDNTRHEGISTKAILFSSAVAGAAAAGGEVLGASTSNLDGMSWKEKIALLQSLDAHIKTLQGSVGSDDEIRKRLDELNQLIAQLEKDREVAQGKADNFLNKIIPDFPLEADPEDGVPWRVKADDYEDQVKAIDAQLLQLKPEQANLQNYIDVKSDLQNGIPPDGPTPADKRNILGGCTNYVATKRDVSSFYKGGHMNAHYWNENAVNAGLEVGETPVKGAIMVFEADGGAKNGIMDVDNEVGHVAYVENVTRVDGGYQVEFSHGNTLYDANGNYISGTYKPMKNETRFIPDGNTSVSFIY